MMRFKLLRGIGGFTGLTLIEILIDEIKIAKNLFLLNLAQGEELLIPRELSQNNMPMSYRFYDPILSMIQSDLDEQ